MEQTKKDNANPLRQEFFSSIASFFPRFYFSYFFRFALFFYLELDSNTLLYLTHSLKFVQINFFNIIHINSFNNIYYYTKR